MQPEDRLANAKSGNAYALAKCARMLDDRNPAMLALLPQIYQEAQGAQIIGLTGNPGAGKSTLTNQMVTAYRAQGLKVAVIAVDPSSPFTGGAILGDRVRMQTHAGDENVFIRSVATRGVLGGISHSTRDLIALFDCLGFDRILVETVGVGQDEIDIAFTVQTNIVVCLPGTGDGVQMIKAGLLETADLFVLNKADHPDSDQALRQLKTLVDWSKTAEKGRWTIPVCATIATKNEGVESLIHQINDHQAYLSDGEKNNTRALLRKRRWIEEIILARIKAKTHLSLDEASINSTTNPYLYADSFMKRFLNA